MASKGTRVSNKEVERMVALYKVLGSYAAVGRKMRRNPATVAKYIQQYEVSIMTAEMLFHQGITKASYRQG